MSGAALLAHKLVLVVVKMATAAMSMVAAPRMAVAVMARVRAFAVLVSFVFDDQSFGYLLGHYGADLARVVPELLLLPFRHPALDEDVAWFLFWGGRGVSGLEMGKMRYCGGKRKGGEKEIRTASYSKSILK